MRNLLLLTLLTLTAACNKGQDLPNLDALTTTPVTQPVTQPITQDPVVVPEYLKPIYGQWKDSFAGVNEISVNASGLISFKGFVQTRIPGQNILNHAVPGSGWAQIDRIDEYSPTGSRWTKMYRVYLSQSYCDPINTTHIVIDECMIKTRTANPPVVLSNVSIDVYIDPLTNDVWFDGIGLNQDKTSTLYKRVSQ